VPSGADAKADASRLEPVCLLGAAGIGIGFVFSLSKFANIAGIPPLLFIGLSAFGASMILFILAALLNAPIRPTRRTFGYAVVAGALTYAIPFGVLAFVVGHVESGVTAILQSLTPVFTLVVLHSLRRRRPEVWEFIGLALGLFGVLIIILLHHEIHIGQQPPMIWFALAFITPLSLSLGNVYRSIAWPADETPVTLAALSLAAAAIFVLVPAAVWHAYSSDSHMLTLIGAGWWIVTAQSLASGLGYFFFFRLQKVGGPIYLSQISYVNTMVGVAGAALFFNEPIGVTTLLAVALIFSGVALVNRTAS